MIYTLDLHQFGTRRVSFFLAVERHLLTSPKWSDKELFFVWDKYPAIVCGRHQLIEAEVNTAYARKLKVPVYRRHSGGGTIYADMGCFMFSFIHRTQKREQVFAHSLSFVNEALRKIGLAVELSGRNDLIFKGKKFSGNAYFKGATGSVLHGTLLYNSDIDQLVRLITPDNEKLISKGIESVRQRVINIGPHVGAEMHEFMHSLENEIAPQRLYLDIDDLKCIAQYEQIYLSNKWIWDNNPPYTFRNKIHTKCGAIQVSAEINDDTLTSVRLSGDFFTHLPLEELYDRLIGIQITHEGIKKVCATLDLGDYILSAENEMLFALFEV